MVDLAKQNPLVPIGLFATIGFLTNGFRQMIKGDVVQQQYMMRGRVAAQGFTVMALVGGMLIAQRRSINENKSSEDTNN